MIVTYNNNIFGFPARFPVTVPVPAVALTVCVVCRSENRKETDSRGYDEVRLITVHVVHGGRFHEQT